MLASSSWTPARPSRSYLSLMKLNLLERRDLEEVGRALIPERLKPLAYELAHPLLDVVYG